MVTCCALAYFFYNRWLTLPRLLWLWKRADARLHILPDIKRARRSEETKEHVLSSDGEINREAVADALIIEERRSQASLAYREQVFSFH